MKLRWTVFLWLILLSHVTTSPVFDHSLLLEFDCRNGNVVVLFRRTIKFSLRFPDTAANEFKANGMQRTSVVVPNPDLIGRNQLYVTIEYEANGIQNRKTKRFKTCKTVNILPNLKFKQQHTPTSPSSNPWFSMSRLMALFVFLTFGLISMAFKKTKGVRKVAKLRNVEDIELQTFDTTLLNTAETLTDVSFDLPCSESTDKPQKRGLAPHTPTIGERADKQKSLNKDKYQAKKARVSQNDTFHATSSTQAVSNSNNHKKLDDTACSEIVSPLLEEAVTKMAIVNEEPDHDIEMSAPEQSAVPSFKSSYDFTQTDLTTSFEQDSFRNNVQLMGFILTMCVFALTAGPWKRIMLLDPMICQFHDGKDQVVSAENLQYFVYGHSQKPDLVLYPAFLSHGHWILIAVNMDSKTITTYDPLSHVPNEACLKRVNELEMNLHVLDVTPHGSLRTGTISEASYNMQNENDSVNCGVFVALYAEQLAFTGKVTRKPLFDIVAERNRFITTCVRLHNTNGRLESWTSCANSSYATSEKADVCIDDSCNSIRPMILENDVSDASSDTYFDLGGIENDDPSLIRYDDGQRNDVQVTGVLTAMARYVSFLRRKRVAVLDSLRSQDYDGNRNLNAAGAKSKLRGFKTSLDMILYPANINRSHWVLMIADIRTRSVNVFDSNNPNIISPSGDTALRLSQFIHDLSYFTGSPFQFKPHGCCFNEQHGGLDCGVYVAVYAEQLLFTGTTSVIEPFDIAQERNRFFKVCSLIAANNGIVDPWPKTCLQGFAEDEDFAELPIATLPVPLNLDCFADTWNDYDDADTDDDDNIFTTDFNAAHFNDPKKTTPTTTKSYSHDVTDFDNMCHVNDAQMIAFVEALIDYNGDARMSFDRVGYVLPAFGYCDNADILQHWHYDYDDLPDIILFPTRASSKSGHWYLIVADPLEGVVQLFDPLDGNARAPLPDGVLMAQVDRFTAAMQTLGYLDETTEYEQPDHYAFRHAAIRTEYGIYVARYMEELVFTSSITRLEPFDVEDERKRFYDVCSNVVATEGHVSDWPSTTEERRFNDLPSAHKSGVLTLIELDPEPVIETKQPPLRKAPSRPAPSKSRDSHPSRSATSKFHESIATNDLKKLRKQLKKKRVPWCSNPFGPNGTGYFLPVHYLGEMTEFGRCPDCTAYLFPAETSAKCCSNGDVRPMKLREPGRMIPIVQCPDYFKNITKIESMFRMVSCSCTKERKENLMTMGGQIRFNVGQVVIDDEKTATFQQCYLLDPQDAEKHRLLDAAKLGLNNGDPRRNVSAELLGLIEIMLRTHHPLTNAYKFLINEYDDYAAKLATQNELPQQLYLIWLDNRQPVDSSTHKGCLKIEAFNGQKFMVWKSGDGEPPRNCLMIARDTGGFVRTIASWNAQMLSCLYPLMFPYGQPGWQPQTLKQRFVPHPASKKIDPGVISDDDDPAYDNVQDDYRTQARPPSQMVRRSQRATAATSQLPPPSQNASVSVAPTYDAVSCQKHGTQGPNVDVTDSFVDANTIDVSSSEDSDSDDDKKKQQKIYVSPLQFLRSLFFDRSDRQKTRFHMITSQRDAHQTFVMQEQLKLDSNKLDQMERIQRINSSRYEVTEYLRNTLQRLIDGDDKLKGQKLGDVLMIPDKYRGGIRDMQRQFRDAIATCLQVGGGKCDFFVTMTGNPNWREITENLRPGEKYYDRPDLVCRVFKLKAKEFLDDLIKNDAIGKVKAYNVSLEHQKRGMPHIHLILIMTDEYRQLYQTAEGLESILSAEIPELPEETDDPTPEDLAKRRLWQNVTTYNMHNPSKCARYCGLHKFIPGLCKKKFPRPFSDETMFIPGEYAQLKRPENGRMTKVPTGSKRKPLSNQHVVTYCPALLMKYNTHMNIEHCLDVSCMKYIYKYQMKGHDRAFVQVKVDATKSKDGSSVLEYNEFTQHKELRIINALEAFMRILGHWITKRSHAVLLLHVHLEGKHITTFGTDEPPEDLAKRVAPGMPTKSKLIAYMATVAEELTTLKGKNVDETCAPNLRYVEMPKYYAWNARTGCWNRRQRLGKTIARMQVVFPRNRELYALRELLRHEVGVSSYASLLTYNDKTYSTFFDAAVARGFLINDDATRATMLELFAYITNPKYCRQNFALMIVYNRPSVTNAIENDLAFASNV